jgi:hypothetical protein
MMTFNQKKYIGIGIAIIVVIIATLCYALRSQPFKMDFMDSSGIIITAEQLELILNNEGINILAIEKGLPRIVIETGDSSYELPKETWFTNKFLFDFKRFIAVANKTFFKVNANDCDKFSLFFHTTANLVPRSKQVGVAIGEVWYSNPSHSINIGVCIDGNGKTNVIFIEPQSPGKVELTKLQKDSIYSARF